MADSGVRSGIRKKATLRLGRKIARFAVGKDKELFTVHEDLICVSPFFRNILQPRRKPVEGDCSICHDALDPETKELTYCSSSCGGNFHRSCIDDLTDHTPENEVTKCPLCRQPWTFSSDMSHYIHQLPTLDSEGFEIFLEWLYNPNTVTGRDATLPLLHACMLGSHFEAQKFHAETKRAVYDSCKRNSWPDILSIRKIYATGTEPYDLRRAVVALYKCMPPAVLERAFDYPARFPPAFTRDLLVALATERDKTPRPRTLA
ncbi:hypothetical protein C7974DRAFT_389414 [Boeremia exigua]|uniref:uncharacterized protein n=1 Tax=Boeremia exigua TaxID=749465 RepID=UPI001E8DE7B0|nr:uncharacterized protein C7974DRAFT_389414 [Boeremia exigua]KAH6637389.1 hypothetical protein C7974DRAFT_389414 [Boeremia exigua]